MTASTAQEVPFVFAVPLLRAQRIISLVLAGFFLLMTIYLALGMGLNRFVNMLSEEPFMWAFMAFMIAPIAVFVKMAYPSPRFLSKLEARRGSIRFVPTWFVNRIVGEPILEVAITPKAKEIVLSRDWRDKLSTTWSVSILSIGEPERSFKTTRLNVTTAQEGHRIVEGIGAATGLPVRMVTRQQTANGTVEEAAWAPPASQGKLFGVGLAIMAMPYIGGAVAGYVFPRPSSILAIGFALWLFDLLAISAFARRSRPRTQNLGAHLLARFFMFWTGYGIAFVLVAYVLRGH
jgi:hypothetical protein